MNPLFYLLFWLAVIGFGVWLLGLLPIAEPYKTIMRGVVLFVVVIMVLYALFSYIPLPPVHR